MITQSSPRALIYGIELITAPLTRKMTQSDFPAFRREYLNAASATSDDAHHSNHLLAKQPHLKVRFIAVAMLAIMICICGSSHF